MSVKFPHKAPPGMYYSQELFKTNITSVWIHYERKFDYNNGQPVKCIWGFWNSKTKKWYAPINSKTVGKSVDPKNTTPYTSMPLNINPLMSCFE